METTAALSWKEQSLLWQYRLMSTGLLADIIVTKNKKRNESPSLVN